MSKLIPMIVLFTMIIGMILLIRYAHKQNGEYDERQVIARGEAYRTSFLSAMFSTFFFAMVIVIYHLEAYAFSFMCLSMVIALTVLTCLSIWKDAFHQTVNEPKKYYLLVGINVINCSIQTITRIDGMRFTAFIQSVNCLFLYFLVSFLLISVTLFLKLRRNKVEAMDDEESKA